jgi:hypothetical protein
MPDYEGEYNTPISGGARGRVSFHWVDMLVYFAAIAAIILLIWYLVTKTGADIASGISKSVSDAVKPVTDPIKAGADIVTGAADAAGGAVNYVVTGANDNLINAQLALAAVGKVAATKATTGAIYDPAFDPNNPFTAVNRTRAEIIVAKINAGMHISDEDYQWALANDPTLAGMCR